MHPIVTSLLDTDFYKLTMMQVVFSHYPEVQAEYHFIPRGTEISDFSDFRSRFIEQVTVLSGLSFHAQEIAYLRSLGLFSESFLRMLSAFRLCPEHEIFVAPEAPFRFRICGPWWATILYEVPLLSIVTELYAAQMSPSKVEEGRRRLEEKIKILQGYGRPLTLIDFGTRRRYSRFWHEELWSVLRERLPEYWVGSSNVWLSMRAGLPPSGTMAHEYLQAFQVLAPGGVRASVPYALRLWAEHYRGRLAIALTDVFRLRNFLEVFDASLCRVYEGVRHDSGDPWVWGEALLQHFKANGIDPKDKTLVYSNDLNVNKIADIAGHFLGRCRLVFGVGTNLTHDVGVPAPSWVIKLAYINGQPVAKLTDDSGKSFAADAEYLRYLEHILGRYSS